MQIKLLILFTIVFFIFTAKQAEAATTTYSKIYTNNSGDYASKPTCPDTSGCNTGPCFNSASAGSTDCGTACDGGNAWSKYSYSNICYLESTSIDPGTGQTINRCRPVYSYDSAVYSTADKCSDGSNSPPSEPYLRAGRCDGSIGGIYKTCCSNTSPSYVSSSSCVAVTPASGAPTPPMDGVCPGGTHSVQCGFGGLPSCGQEACGPLPPPPPPPPPAGCNCSYPEDCTTTDGRAGTWWCGGINDGGTCRYDGGACQPNCTTCIASAEGGSQCGQNGCQTSLGETCSNCPRDCGNCNSGYRNPPTGLCETTIGEGERGMALYVDPRTNVGDGCPGNRGCSGKFVQGDVFIVTATGEKGGRPDGQKFGCSQNIRTYPRGKNVSSSTVSCTPRKIDGVLQGFKCKGDGGFTNNPKDDRACWWQWECKATDFGGPYNFEVEATHYDYPSTCDDECFAGRGYEVIASGRIKGSIFVDSNANGLLDSGEKIIRESTTPCSGTEFHTDDSFSIDISGTRSMTLEPKLCNTTSLDPDQRVPYFDTGLILPTGGYTVRLNYNSSIWQVTNGDVRNITLNPTLSQQRTLFGVKPPLPPVPLPVTKPACSNTTYSATLNWQNTSSVLWADIDEPAFVGTFYNKDVGGRTSVTIPTPVTGFNEVNSCPPGSGCVAMPALQPDKTYVWRLWTGSPPHIYGPQWTVPSCVTAWIQTIGGDVHSNGRIDLGGGP